MTNSIKTLFPRTQNGEEYPTEIAKLNINIFPILCLIICVFDCILLASTFLYILEEDVIGNWIYLGFYTFNILYAVITMLVLKKLSHSVEQNTGKINGIITAFVIVNYLIGGAITCLDVYYIHDFSTLAAVCIEMCFLYCKPKRVLPIFIIDCLVIYLGGIRFLGLSLKTSATLLNSILLTVFIFIFSIHRYRTKLFEIEQSYKLTVVKNQFKELAEIDSLTKLYNRSYLNSYLKNYDFSGKNTIGVAILDIDDFKQINDTYGHLTGDECLRLIGRTVKKASKSQNKNSMAFRYGGEEILLLFENYAKDEIFKAAESVRTSIMNESVMGIKFTASIGIYYSNKPFPSFNEMIKKSDKNLYIAKKDGKNKVIIN